ncbi:hypothetical protein CGCS363_v006147 [Colletotrichum siamense]|uniref:uncharacterized protein n=1 Tax=Colletotrichum siamense TaxID=690259 RepID=UPI0018729200|nr:uncharacterized protein CGCS363_v006147 [Colletotrichum siamense]KAF5500060.1 hypothetical protein CGCS363_v006147 [Colletotrichum siamense]
MKVPEILVLVSMALGATARCKKAIASLCESNSSAVAQGFTSSFTCQSSEELPCQTECITTGTKGIEVAKCCKSACMMTLHTLKQHCY